MKKYLSRELAIIELMKKYGEKLSNKSNEQLGKEYKKQNKMFSTDKVIVSDTPKESVNAFNLNR